jgi:hypothetical protein
MANRTISIVNFPHPCSNIPISPAYGVLYLTANWACNSLFDMRSISNSGQSTDKQVDVSGVSTFLFTGRFSLSLRSLQWSSFEYNLPLSQMHSDVFHTNRKAVFIHLSWPRFASIPKIENGITAGLTGRQGMLIPPRHLIPFLYIQRSVFDLFWNFYFLLDLWDAWLFVIMLFQMV